jgi:hypothetical protein
MKPKHVGEQHKQLFSPEFNYSPKVLKKRKEEELVKLADDDIKAYLEEECNDEGGI